MVWYDIVPCGKVWCGMVWCSLGLCGLVWCGIVWCGGGGSCVVVVFINVVL